MIREVNYTGNGHLSLGKFFTSKLAPLAYVDTSNPRRITITLTDNAHLATHKIDQRGRVYSPTLQRELPPGRYAVYTSTKAVNQVYLTPLSNGMYIKPLSALVPSAKMRSYLSGYTAILIDDNKHDITLLADGESLCDILDSTTTN